MKEKRSRKIGIFFPTDNLKSNRIDEGDRTVLNGVNLTWFFWGEALKLMERIAYVSSYSKSPWQGHLCSPFWNL